MEQQPQMPNPGPVSPAPEPGPGSQIPVQSPVNTPPVIPAQPAAPMPAPVQSKSHVWAWVLGGCFMIVIIGMIAVAVLGWWGFREAKKEINKYAPDVESVKQNIDKMSKEGEAWEKKSQELRESLPNPEDFSKEMPVAK